MNMTYQRFDYPAQCFKAESYSRFIKAPNAESFESASNILIVTNRIDIIEKFNTLFNLVQWLSQSGASVDVLYINEHQELSEQWSQLLLSQKNVALHCLSEQVSILQSPIADVMGASFQFDAWLLSQDKHYQTVFAYEDLSLVYYSLLKKELGLISASTRFVAYASSVAWFDSVKASAPILNPSQLNVFYAQEQVLSLLDGFLSNSFQLLVWLSEQYGDESSLNYQFVNMPQDLSAPILEGVGSRKSDLVFVFSAHDFREASLCLEVLKDMPRVEGVVNIVLPPKPPKGLRKLFTDVVLDNVAELRIVNILPEMFDWSSVVDAAAIIVPSSEHLSAALLSYLRFSDVMLIENEVYQDANGGASVSVFHHNPGLIKARLIDVLNGVYQRPLCDVEPLKEQLFSPASDQDSSPINNVDADTVSISVCISHCNRGVLLLRAIESVRKQTRACQEIIVVDDGSVDAHALSVLVDLERGTHEPPVRVLRQEKSFIGASRNRGLADVRGDYVMFMDDDNEAKEDEIEVFLRAALHSDADILTCLSEVFTGDSPQESTIDRQVALFVGANQASSLFANPFGDSNMFAKTARVRAIGGFSEYYRVGRDDHEFFVRAQRAGLSVKLLPQALYYYRLNEKRIRHTHINQYAGPARVAQSYAQAMKPQSAQMVRYAQSLSYGVGPFGINPRFLAIKLRLIESARIYMAKFPFLYRFFQTLKSFF